MNPKDEIGQAGDHAEDHGPVLMALHWLTAVLVVAAFALGPGGSETRVYSVARDFDRQWHEVLGLAILVLTVVRLVWRALREPAAEEPPVTGWMERVAMMVRVALYLLLVATPLTAVFGAWLEGHPLTLGVLGDVPSPLGVNRALGTALAEVHGFLGDAILWLAGVHAVAALYHHYVLRDGVLLGMLPRRLRNGLAGNRPLLRRSSR